jgi:uncharacterized protein
VFEIGQSPIHGFGCFATVAIAPDTLIGRLECVTARPDGDGTHVVWVEDEPLLVLNELRYLNHAPDPNAELDELDLRALRPIAPGEEITIHYGEDWPSTSS